ncbi:hypothetical protein U1Q18_015460 [Sarracenia purpurea var. burkii]
MKTWPPQISCYHCTAFASASDQPLRAAEVAPLSPLQPLRTAPLITRRSSRAQCLRQRSPHRPSRLHSRALPSHLRATILLQRSPRNRPLLGNLLPRVTHIAHAPPLPQAPPLPACRRAPPRHHSAPFAFCTDLVFDPKSVHTAASPTLPIQTLSVNSLAHPKYSPFTPYSAHPFISKIQPI